MAVVNPNLFHQGLPSAIECIMLTADGVDTVKRPRGVHPETEKDEYHKADALSRRKMGRRIATSALSNCPSMLRPVLPYDIHAGMICEILDPVN